MTRSRSHFSIGTVIILCASGAKCSLWSASGKWGSQALESFETIENTMQILHHHKKGAHLNTIEWYYIHAEHTANNHLNYEHTIFPNKIFDTLLKTYHP